MTVSTEFPDLSFAEALPSPVLTRQAFQVVWSVAQKVDLARLIFGCDPHTKCVCK